MTESLQQWAERYVMSTSLDVKLTRLPRELEVDPHARSVVLGSPGRPAELHVTSHAPKSPGPTALRSPQKRAQMIHTFFHHELQAAELMAWAILRFSDQPHAFLRGLAKIADDEIRHMNMYGDYLAAHGFKIGDFPVRDWFWDRVPSVSGPRGFVATFGMGFEAANLDHTKRFAAKFRAIDDEAAARLQDVVGEEEIPHVRFAIHWYSRLSDDLDFQGWSQALPEPLSPMFMRGNPINHDARTRAGFPQTFLDELDAWKPRESGI